MEIRHSAVSLIQVKEIAAVLSLDVKNEADYARIRCMINMQDDGRNMPIASYVFADKVLKEMLANKDILAKIGIHIFPDYTNRITEKFSGTKPNSNGKKKKKKENK